ncbi:hypothetical protein Tco_1262216 [Tanacetum coccineum]
MSLSLYIKLSIIESGGPPVVVLSRVKGHDEDPPPGWTHIGFEVLDHVIGESTSETNPTPPTVEWLKADSIIKSWFFVTLSDTLQERLVVADPKTAKEAWDNLEKIFLDNKRTKTIALKDLNIVRSMVTTEELRLNNKSQATLTDATSSSPTIILAESSSQPRRGGRDNPVVKNVTTQAYEVVPFERQDNVLKMKLAKNNEAEMVLYNDLPKKEYERISLDELIENLKVHEVIMEKDSEVYKGKKERVKSIALKAKKESSDDEILTSGIKEEEYAMAVKDFEKFFRKNGRYSSLVLSSTSSYIGVVEGAVIRALLDLEYLIEIRSTALMMAAAVQNTNNTTIRSILQHEKLTGLNFTNWFQNLRIVLRSERKLVHLEQPMTTLPYPVASQAARDAYEALNDAQNEVACLMLGSMSTDFQRTLENY